MDSTDEVGEIGQQLEPLQLTKAHFQHGVQQGGVAEGWAGEHLRGTPDVDVQGALVTEHGAAGCSEG